MAESVSAQTGEPGFWLPIDDIEYWDANPNQGDVGSIYESIRSHGFNGALELFGGVAYVGNHRHKALMLLRRDGWTPRGTAVRVSPDGEWQVFCQSIDYMDAQTARSYAIARNRTRDRASTDLPTLLAHLEQLESVDPQMVLPTGYDLEDLELIRAEVYPAETDDEPKSKKADDGLVRISVKVPEATAERYGELVDATGQPNEAAAFKEIIAAAAKSILG